jgi:hypothetical protein
MPKQSSAPKSHPTKSPSSRTPSDRRSSVHVWHPNGGRPRQYDDTPHTARPVPSMPSKPFDWRGDDDKQALAYLRSSGAGAINVAADVDGCAIRVGFDPADDDVVEVFWLPAAKARSIAARARHIAAHWSRGRRRGRGDPSGDGRSTGVDHLARHRDRARGRDGERARRHGRGDASERPAQSLQHDVQGASIGGGCKRSRLQCPIALPSCACARR